MRWDCAKDIQLRSCNNRIIQNFHSDINGFQAALIRDSPSNSRSSRSLPWSNHLAPLPQPNRQKFGYFVTSQRPPSLGSRQSSPAIRMPIRPPFHGRKSIESSESRRTWKCGSIFWFVDLQIWIHCNSGSSLALRPHGFIIRLDRLVIKLWIFVACPQSQCERIMIRQLVLSKIAESTWWDRYRELKPGPGPSDWPYLISDCLNYRATAETLLEREPDHMVLSISPLCEIIHPCLNPWQKRPQDYQFPLKTSQKGKMKWVLSKSDIHSQIPFLNALGPTLASA